MSTPARAPSLGSLIDKMQAVREKKRLAEEKVKAHEEEYDDLEAQVLAALAKEGVESAAGRMASVSVSTLTRPKVEDWTEFYTFIKKKGAFQLLERRPASSGCNEFFDAGKQIPGVVKVELKRLNLRTKKA